MAEGYGVARHDVMYNDFVLVGPGSDPAGLRGLDDAAAALARVAAARAPFTSRGDGPSSIPKLDHLHCGPERRYSYHPDCSHNGGVADLVDAASRTSKSGCGFHRRAGC